MRETVPFSEADYANIPVNICVDYDDEKGKWVIIADNYMPRKSWVNEGVFYAEKDTYQGIENIVNMYILPLYQNAIEHLKKECSLTYWDKPKKSDDEK